MSDFCCIFRRKADLLVCKDTQGRMTSTSIVDKDSHCNELIISTGEISLSNVIDTTFLPVACRELPLSAAPRMFSLSTLSLSTRYKELSALVAATVV